MSGEVGTGKTMLARVLIGRLPPHLRAIYLADPLMNRHELLAVLADELGCTDTAGDSAHEMLRAAQQALVAEFSAGRQIVLLIDAAHAMPADTLEQIRLLSNLESERHKLIKIALFGQPELDALRDRPDMRQLKDRITQHFRLDPLAPDDVATSIDFRMRAAGYRGPAAARLPHGHRGRPAAGGDLRRLRRSAQRTAGGRGDARVDTRHSTGDAPAAQPARRRLMTIEFFVYDGVCIDWRIKVLIHHRLRAPSFSEPRPPPRP